MRTSLIYGGAEPAPQERMALEVADGVRDMAFFTDEVRCPIAVADLAAAVLELAELVDPAHRPPPARCTSPAPTRSRAWTSPGSSAAHHGRDPALLRGGPPAPSGPSTSSSTARGRAPC